MKRNMIRYIAAFATFGLLVILSQPIFAAVPVVKTVPWVASNALIPHDTWIGKSIRLKGTSDQQGASFIYTWDFGDGSPVVTGTVTNKYAIEASHVYTSGAVGSVYQATLTVQDTSIPAPNTGSAKYYVAIQTKSLPVEVNVAIDEGLWYLHKDFYRNSSCMASNSCWANSYNAETPANVTAFFVNGHLETGAASNPYTETVQRAMKRLFALLNVSSIGSQAYPAPIGTVNPDVNANGIGLYGSDSYNYSSGLFIDAIVASGTPDAIATTGNATWVAGRKYKDIVQDMVDFDAYSQTDSGTWMGGWGYGANYGTSDNSVNQWEVIGLMAANGWGGTVVVPPFVATANQNSLANTHGDQGWDGSKYTETFFRYTNNSDAGWGWMGTTPAGMVQMVFDGITRGNALWDRTENFIRNNFCANPADPRATPLAYYYGLFSFTKSMLLYPGGNLQYLTNRYPVAGANPIDWYAAESSAGAQCNGVARTLVDAQLATGNWGNHAPYDGYHNYFQATWAIIMLNRTVFASGVPVAVIQATPNPAVAGQVINLSGANSYGQGGNAIVAWDWDLDNNGTFETPGVTATVSFPAVGSYPVKLRVTDNANPQQTAVATLTILVTIPPIAPTANAGGPYNFCQGNKWFLDGSGSINPDNGQHEPGAPGDFIKQYAWDLNLDSVFTDAFGVAPDVTGFWGTGDYVIQLKVTDNTSLSFPSSGMGDLSSVASTQVKVRAMTDPACTCVNNLAARPKPTKADLTWAWKAGAVRYNVYRATVSGGPYVKIGSVNAPGLPNTGVYADFGLTNGTTYYYVVREAALNGNEICQSNQASAKPVAR